MGLGVLILLADEEHLAVLRKCPYLVINLSLELVDVVTDLVHKWLYGIVICNSLLTLRLNLVSYATRLCECFATFFDCLNTL